MSIVETWRADKATRNGGDSVAKCHERTATVFDVRLDFHILRKTFNRTEWSCGCDDFVPELTARN